LPIIINKNRSKSILTSPTLLKTANFTIQLPGMKALTVILLCLLYGLSGSAQSSSKQEKTIIADASCGECQFNLEGKGCDLAVRIDGKAYFVDGTKIDDHGDAHAKDGFCNAIRKAEIRGKIVKNRFKATYFKLLEEPQPKSVDRKSD
jgi:hypothetical protein